MGGEEIVKAPKTDAGRRTVAIPPNVQPLVEQHLEVYVDPQPDAPLLVGEKGRALLVKALNNASTKRAPRSAGPTSDSTTSGTPASRGLPLLEPRSPN